MRDDEILLPPPPATDRPNDHDLVDEEGRVVGSTWKGTRRKITRFLLLGTLGCAIVGFVLVRPAVVFKPGPLSSSHAQILAGTMTSERCGTCHPKAGSSPLAFFNSGGVGHSGVEQSELCIRCHHQLSSPGLELTAHNLPSTTRDQMTAAVRLASNSQSPGVSGQLMHGLMKSGLDQNNVACSVCHKEHHGSQAPLTTMTNAQCESCHNQFFGGFSRSHPEWSNWPYGRGGEIAFNHKTHAEKHFPNAKSGTQSFDCRNCHRNLDAGVNRSAMVAGELSRSQSYESSCQACHQDSLQIATEKGFALLTLPTIPEHVAGEIPGWPSTATGYPDGVISPVMELLLRSDDDVAKAMRRIPGNDFSRLSPADAIANQRMQLIGQAIRQLAHDLGEQGHDAFERRLVDGGLSPDALLPVIRTLPPQWLESLSRNWFQTDSLGSDRVDANQASRPASRIASAEEELAEVELAEEELVDFDLFSESDELLSGGVDDTDLSEDPLVSSSARGASQPLQPTDRLKFGGWYFDELRSSLRFRAQGHADPMLIALIETFSQLGEGDPLRQRFFAMPSVAGCIRCHPQATQVPARWTASERIGDRSQFTKFVHGPHLNVSALGDCVHCHQLSEVELEHTSLWQGSTATEFRPLAKAACDACHTPQAAGENCTTCHRYHIHR